MKRILLLNLLMTFCSLLFAQHNERRIALVVGNSEYQAENSIPNAVNDAKLMAKNLEALGFMVIHLSNTSRDNLESAILNFGKLQKYNNVALFYYSGHAVSYNGRNYLLPSKCNIKSARDLSAQAIDLDAVLQGFRRQPESINLLVVDAFRDINYSDEFSSRILQVAPQSGTLVAYAAASNSVSADGENGYGMYTSALASQILLHQSIDEVFGNVRQDLKQRGSAQTPAEWSELNGKFYFKTSPFQKTEVNSETEIFIIPRTEEPAILKITSSMLGKFYLNNQSLGTFEKGSVYTLPNIAPGLITLKQNDWTEELLVESDKTYEIFTGKKIEIIKKVVVDKTGVDMIKVLGGTFKIGSEKGDEDEKPVHEVVIDDFSLSRYEITNAQYCKFLNEIQCSPEGKIRDLEYIDMDDEDCQILHNGTSFETKPGKENYPVIEVSWYGADAYCVWAGGRLPTEAEWEYAARGGQKAQGYVFSGSNTVDEVAWHRDNAKDTNVEFSTQPVGQKKPNALGFYDMSGNVWEWCSDWYSPYTLGKKNNPQGAKTGRYRSLRGGSCRFEFERCRVAYRYSRTPMYSNDDRGFRLAR